MKRKHKSNKINDTKPKKKGMIWKIIFYLIIVLFIIGALGAGALYLLVNNILEETPPIKVYDIKKLLEQNSEIYDSQGNLMEKVEDNGLRTIVEYSQIDKDIIDAIVSVEDKTFWTHKGFNYVRLAGSVLEALKTGHSPSGTSTITQQYARNMYLSDSRFAKGKSGYIRKTKEAYYAIDIEKNMSKEEILSAYLNTIEFGAKTKGIQAATMRYFSKNCNDIDYIEAAMLAGIPKANVTYSPFKIINSNNVKPDDFVLGQDSANSTIIFNKSSVDRYKVVLKVMFDNGVITQEEYDKGKDFDIKTKLKPSPLNVNRFQSYPVDMVKNEVVKKLMKFKNLTKEEATNMLYRGGLRINSTIDPVIQGKLERSFNGETVPTLYDQGLVTAVRAFQAKYGMQVDGVAGPKTFAKLVELGLVNPNEFSGNVLRPGMNNDDIKLLRYAMESQGLIFYKNTHVPDLLAYRNASKDIVSVEEGYQNVMINHYNSIIDAEQNLIIKPKNFYVDAAGNYVFKKHMMFNFYVVPGYESDKELRLFLKEAYKCDESSISVLAGAGRLYSQKISLNEIHIFDGGVLNISGKYAKFNDAGEYVLDKSFLTDHPDFFKKGQDGSLIVAKSDYYIANQGIVQPQAAMSVIDYRTGQLKGIMGGRNVTGNMIYNRALNPRQPGSSIKPLGAYVPALDNGFNTSSVFYDNARLTPSGRSWPKNWYKGFKGAQTMRQAVEWSGNVIAVKTVDAVGVEKCVEYLKKFGISTLVEEGEINDYNVSAVALGGMTKGATPLDMAGAFGAIANGGVREETITFTTIYDSEGNLVLENTPEETFVVSEQVAWLMESMLLDAVEHGFSRNQSAIRPYNRGIPVAGKTGTTSNRYDIWFCGYTPYYTGAMWIGSDINLEVTASSSKAAKYWKYIMKDVHEGYENKSFKKASDVGVIGMYVDSKSGLIPSSLSRRDPAGNIIVYDYFIPGNQPTRVDNLHKEVKYCSEGKCVATPLCPESSVVSKVFRIRPKNFNRASLRFGSSDSQYMIGKADIKSPSVCPVHNGEVEKPEETEEKYPEVNMTSGLNGLKQDKSKYGYTVVKQSVFVYTTKGEKIQVNAGSKIYASGNIVTTTGRTIKSIHIKGYEKNSGGPAYVEDPNDKIIKTDSEKPKPNDTKPEEQKPDETESSEGNSSEETESVEDTENKINDETSSQGSGEEKSNGEADQNG